MDRKRKGKIKDIVLQPSWDLFAHHVESECGRKIGKYTADFSYYDCVTNQTIVVDIKGQVPGVRTLRNGRKRHVSGGKGWTAFRLRCKIVEANYGIKVQVVAGAAYTKAAKLAGAKPLRP
jgi:very-short-patch-repair endonuclease